MTAAVPNGQDEPTLMARNIDLSARLMQAWADYLDELPEAGKVITMRRENS